MYKTNLIILFWYGTFILNINARRNDQGSLDIYKQCIPITEPVCQDVKYTHTIMPNLVGISSENEASKRIQEYYPLLNLQCSQYLKLYLCSIYIPMCDKESPTITPLIQPCRRLCEHVKSRCEPFMLEIYNKPWPNELNCERLQPTDKLCLSPDSFNLDKDIDKSSKYTETKKRLYYEFQLLMKKRGKYSPKIENFNNVDNFLNFKCLPSHFNIVQMPNISCAQRCEADVKFNEGDKVFANIWLIGWSMLCLFSSLFTIGTFLCDTKRFMYPEKPIVFLSICYFFLSSGNLLGALVGRRNVICRSFNEELDFLISNGNENTWCKIIFLIVYFFSSASALWWVVLTITWYLSACRHWGYEAIESISSLLHLISWGIPAFKSILVLILHKIDADELTGQCFVGDTDREAMIIFVLIPQIMYLLIGITFLGLGYSSILKIRKSFLEKEDCIDTNNLKRLEKLMAKIGVFSILYIIPVTCTIASYALDAFKLARFEITMKVLYEFSSKCVSKKGLSWSIDNCLNIIKPSLPSVEMRMLRIFMNLVIGITSGIWIWGNKKTFKRCCCFLNNLKDSKGIQLNQFKHTGDLNPLNDFSKQNPGDCQIQLQQWNCALTYNSELVSKTPVPITTEGIIAPNNSLTSGVSSRH